MPNTPTVLIDVASSFDQEHIQLLESFVNQIAIALERAFLAKEAQRALLKAETETIRNTLLSSISHDLRTPLAAITGGGQRRFFRRTSLLTSKVCMN